MPPSRRPPPDFRAIFDGKDLARLARAEPALSREAARGKAQTRACRRSRDEFAEHWRVENGELVNVGTGPYATTDEEFGDIELLIEYKTVAHADSGIYLRGTPQVQIWTRINRAFPTSPTETRTRVPAACSTTRRNRPAGIRWSARTSLSASGTPSAFARSAHARGSGSTASSWSMGQ